MNFIGCHERGLKGANDMKMIERFLANLPIRRRILTVALLPVLGLLVFPVMSAVRDYKAFIELAQTDALLALEPEITSFVHDLQRERGITSGYIASGQLAVFGERLNSQWRVTDATRAPAHRALASFGAATYGADVADPIAQVWARFERLDGVRQRVRQGQISERESLRYYSEFIEALHNIVAYIDVLNQQPELFGIASAYLAILEVAERAGLERAIGTIGFSNGRLEPAVHQQYVELIRAEESFGEDFNRHAPSDLRNVLAVARTGADFAEVRRLRQVAIDNGYGVPVADVSAAMWFDAATQMVDQLIEVKAATAIRLREGVAQSIATNRNELVATLVLTVLVLAVVLALVALVVRSITNPLAHLQMTMGQLALGNNAVEIVGTERRDEVGTMARLIEDIKRTAIAREAERDRLRDNQIRRIRLERQLDQGSRANTAGEMSTAIAHALIQPLASTVNYLDACHQYLKSPAPEAKDNLSTMLDRAARQAHHAAETMKSIVATVRKDGSALAPHDINHVIREITDLMLADADGQYVALHLDLAPDLPLIEIDKMQVRQAVRNLIENAVDAMCDTDNPELSITTSIVSSDQVLLRVTDNGKGLADFVRASLFEPFVTTKADGMGLGLTICRSIAERHGGKLAVESSGDGTTFSLILPRKNDDP